MSLNLKQFQKHIVRPALMHIGLGGLAAERLVIGTALTESRLKYVKQVGGGPAEGLFQMEDATYHDIWNNYLRYQPHFKKKIEELLIEDLPFDDQLYGNLYLAVAMCRIHYYRVPKALPQSDDVEGMANYWKDYYNTRLGKGTPEDFISKSKGILELQ